MAKKPQNDDTKLYEKRGNGKPSQQRGNNNQSDVKPVRRGSRTGNNGGSQRERGNKACNDVSWWNNLGQVTKDSGSYSFYNQMGAKIYGLSSQSVPESMPGLMTLNYVPTIGSVNSSTDPVNAAARLLYDKVNYKNSRNFTYDVPDLMIYVLAMASAYSYHAFLKRAIGVFNTFSQVNRYIPDTVVSAMHIDPNELSLNLTDLRNAANLLARKLNMMAVPAGIPYFERMYWLNSNVYMDDPTMKASLYMFIPAGFYKYSETTDTSGGKLTLDTGIKNGLSKSPQELYDFGMSLIQPILDSQDMANISSDILKAFEGNIVQLTDVDESYAITPVYNPEVLTQINNAITVEGVINKGVTIVQDPHENYLKSTIKGDPNGGLALNWGLDYLVNFPTDNPTADDMFVATRLMPVVNNNGEIISCGTEIINKIQMFKFYQDSNKNWTTKVTEVQTPEVFQCTTDWALKADALELLCDYNKFGSAPTMRILLQNAETKEVTKNLVLSDVQNFTLIPRNDLKTMHESALLSVFAMRSPKPTQLK